MYTYEQRMAAVKLQISPERCEDFVSDGVSISV